MRIYVGTCVPWSTCCVQRTTLESGGSQRSNSGWSGFSDRHIGPVSHFGGLISYFFFSLSPSLPSLLPSLFLSLLKLKKYLYHIYGFFFVCLFLVIGYMSFHAPLCTFVLIQGQFAWLSFLLLLYGSQRLYLGLQVWQ